MSPTVYNASLATALILIGAGAWGQFGWSVAAMVDGALVMALTMIGLRVATRPR